MQRSDAQLVIDARGGDRAALGEIYERYSDRIFSFCLSRLRSREPAADATQDTFVKAAERLGQLRDPERLRPWLFAIARNAIVDQVRLQQRLDSDEELSVRAAEGPEPDADLTRAEAAGLLWEASSSLQARDQELLELHLRHQLEGDDLAAAMGVDRKHCTVLLTRLRDRIERALGALLVSRHGRGDCAALRQVLGDWDGTYTLEVRSRVTRHIESCDRCTRTRAAVLTPANFAAALPLALAPAALAPRTAAAMERALDAAAGPDSGGWRWRDDGFPEPRDTPNTPSGVDLTPRTAVTAAPSADDPGDGPVDGPIDEPDGAGGGDGATTRRARWPLVVAALVLLGAIGLGVALAAGRDSARLVVADGDLTAPTAAAAGAPSGTDPGLAAPSPSPQPTVTPAPTATPTPAPTATPTVAPSPSPTPEPNPSPTQGQVVVPAPTAVPVPDPPGPPPAPPAVTSMAVTPPVVRSDTGTGCTPLVATVVVGVDGPVSAVAVRWTLGPASGSVDAVESTPGSWSARVGPFGGPGEAVLDAEVTGPGGTTTDRRSLAVERCVPTG